MHSIGQFTTDKLALLLVSLSYFCLHYIRIYKLVGKDKLLNRIEALGYTMKKRLTVIMILYFLLTWTLFFISVYF